MSLSVKHLVNSNGPIVIVGCQRSGTTLLRTILGRHPHLLEHPKEPQFILELYQRFGDEVRDVKTAVTYLLNHPYLPETITSESLHMAYAPYQQLSLAQFCQIYLQLWAGDQLQEKRPILKDPALVYHLDLVAKLFPQATIVHVIRDPRGSIASQKTRWQHYKTWECIMLWKKAVQSVSDWYKRGKIPVIEISYEAILLNPHKELMALSQALHIPFLPQMLTFEEKTTDYTPEGVPIHVTFKAVDASRVQQWQERLTPMDIALIEHACQAEMARWGYDLTQPEINSSHFYKQLIYEWLYYGYRINGRFLKNLIRKIGWQLGIGLLKTPPK